MQLLLDLSCFVYRQLLDFDESFWVHHSWDLHSCLLPFLFNYFLLLLIALHTYFYTFSKIPRVGNCCFFLDMTLGGTLLSIFGVVTGIGYIARSFYILYNPHEYEKDLEDDDAFKKEDDMICEIIIYWLRQLLDISGFYRNRSKKIV